MRTDILGKDGDIPQVQASCADLKSLTCPECHSKLTANGEMLVCSGNGEHSWPVIDGVPHFVESFPYWGEIPLDQMVEVNRRAIADRWNSGLLESNSAAVQTAAGMILNLDRTNWQWLLDLPAESRILEIGAGMGTNSHALGLRFHNVVALEPVLERVNFMRQRFAQEKLLNIQIVRGSIWTLPFPPESFDLIVMNGVLEWVSEGSTENPRRIQERALKAILRLLRRGGHLYLGIENRFTLGYFRGFSDPHCGLPFVTVLPRPLAHWYAKRSGQNGYRNYLYSSRGYGRLLRRVGFENIELYVALPSYNHPRFLVPVNKTVFSYYWKTFNLNARSRIRTLLQRLLLALGLMAYLEYSFMIFARKG